MINLNTHHQFYPTPVVQASKPALVSACPTQCPEKLAANLPPRELARRDDIEFSGLPSMIQTLSAVSYIRACTSRIAASAAIADHEGIGDADYKLMQLPLTSVASISSHIAFFKNFSFAKEVGFVTTACKASIIFSFICCILEAIYESCWIFRQKRLLDRPEMQILRQLQTNPSLDKIQQIFDKHKGHIQRLLPPIEIEQAAIIMSQCRDLRSFAFYEGEHRARASLAALALLCLEKKYFQDGDVAQNVKLERRIRPWCFAEVQKELRPAILQLQDYSHEDRIEGMERAKSIFKAIDTQARKKLLLHVMSLIGVALVIAGLAATVFAFPWTITLALIVVGSTLSVVQWCIYSGVLDNHNWEFTPATCIPESVRNGFRKVADKAARTYAYCQKALTEPLPVLYKSPLPA